ncbi:MAG: 3,4-dihydroxy-2-butanone-4-phosphate synthase, partial [Saprospiraceae bacterium]|nr:3,4-dihydroxy-2-butanone-4-phosphate synthase [Saprospiraceae bacterium]
DRATGIKALVDPSIKAEDFARPGHIFPLRAKSGGVLRRTGHTEAAVDLSRLAGYYPAGVLVEILNEDGTMARLPQLLDVAKKFQLKIISIDDLVAYRMRTERLVKKENAKMINTKHGNWEITTYTQITNADTHFTLKLGDWELDDVVPVRVHSGNEIKDIIELLLNFDNDLEKSLTYISKAQKGLILYMNHKEKECDAAEIVKQIDNQDDYILANANMDHRDFGVGAQILRDQQVTRISLLSRHSPKRVGLIGYGLEIVENIKI